MSTVETTTACCGDPIAEDPDGRSYCNGCGRDVDYDTGEPVPTRQEIRERMEEERFDAFRDEGWL